MCTPAVGRIHKGVAGPRTSQLRARANTLGDDGRLLFFLVGGLEARVCGDWRARDIQRRATDSSRFVEVFGEGIGLEGAPESAASGSKRIQRE
jgi:hypothetical protein